MYFRRYLQSKFEHFSEKNPYSKKVFLCSLEMAIIFFVFKVFLLVSWRAESNENIAETISYTCASSGPFSARVAHIRKLCIALSKHFFKFLCIYHTLFKSISHNFPQHSIFFYPHGDEIQARDQVTPGIKSPHSPLNVIVRVRSTPTTPEVTNYG